MATNAGSVFTQLGQALTGIFNAGDQVQQEVQAAQTAATQAFYTIAGELAVVIVLLGLLLWANVTMIRRERT